MAVEASASSKTAKPSFNALYFDTNVLISFNWPTPSLRLENLFGLANWMKISLFLPEPVEKEAEEHWIREVRDSVAGFSGPVREFERVTNRVGGHVAITHDAIKELSKRYRAASAKTKLQFGVSLTPYTNLPLPVLFDLAVRYILPFQAGTKNNRGEGKGFQDALILASILDHLHANPSVSGILVTNDGDFPKVRLDQFMPEKAHLPFEVLTFEEAFSKLYSAFHDEHILKPWEEERQNAWKAVEALEPSLREFIKANLTEEMMGLSGSSKLLDVEKVDVGHITTSLPDPTKPDRSVRIAISVNVRCRVFFEGMGSIFAGALNALAGTSAYQSEPHEGTTSWSGGVDATADVRAREFSNIEFRALLSSERIREELPRIIDPKFDERGT